MAANLFKNKKSKNSTCVLNIQAIEKSNFFTVNAKKTFNHLQLTFIKALILQLFNLKSHIRIETNTLSYTIDRVLS